MYATIEAIEQANRAIGHHWFEPAAMRFFRSRVSSRVYPTPSGAFFVSSERGSHQKARRYSVRFCDARGRIETVGEFQAYAGARRARSVRAFCVRRGACVRARKRECAGMTMTTKEGKRLASAYAAARLRELVEKVER